MAYLVTWFSTPYMTPQYAHRNTEVDVYEYRVGHIEWLVSNLPFLSKLV